MHIVRGTQPLDTDLSRHPRLTQGRDVYANLCSPGQGLWSDCGLSWGVGQRRESELPLQLAVKLFTAHCSLFTVVARLSIRPSILDAHPACQPVYRLIAI